MTSPTSPHSVLFVPHGAPTFALNPGAAGAAMTRTIALQATPRAIVVLSPHWDTAVPTVGTAVHPETLHDFHGFPEPLYRLTYPATGCPEVAELVVQALQAAGLEVQTDAQRGLDHGAWMPLRHLYPEAQIPVIPLSVQSHAGPAHAFRVGQALNSLAENHVLILCSGNLTHNLGDWHRISQQGGPTPAYVQVFTDWIALQLQKGHVDRLLNYRQLSPEGVRAHPSEDHLLPFFTALGAAGPQAHAEAFFRGISDHVIAMDGYTFH